MVVKAAPKPRLPHCDVQSFADTFAVGPHGTRRLKTRCSRMLREFAATLAFSFAGLAASAAGGSPGPAPAALAITAATINEATPNGADDKSPSLIAKAETLLDRAHFSPGEIDGLDGDDFRSAVRAFQETKSLPVTGNLDADTWNALASNDTAPF